MAKGRSNKDHQAVPVRPADRARVAAAQARTDTRHQDLVRLRLRVVITVVVTLAAVVGAVTWAVRGGATPSPSATTASLESVSGVGEEPAPPWPAPQDVPARAQAAGLSLGPMGTAEHYHVHLDVLVNGKAVPVPPNIGVDPVSGLMTGLHTHTPDGVVHIEAARTGQPFTLGQLFTEWNVRLTATQLGGLNVSGNNTLMLFVNGRKVSGNPAMLRLEPHQQIALVYGPVDQKVSVPDSYDFAPGE